MKKEPPDQDEEARARSMFEQCWPAPLGLILFVVFFGVLIHSCKGAECKITWDAPPTAQQVTSWKIYRGIELLQTVTSNSATLDLPDNQASTLTVVAINSVGPSLPTSITVIPFTPKHSEDLRVWIAHPSRCVFVEAKPRMFMSYSFPPL